MFHFLMFFMHTYISSPPYSIWSFPVPILLVLECRILVFLRERVRCLFFSSQHFFCLNSMPTLSCISVRDKILNRRLNEKSHLYKRLIKLALSYSLISKINKYFKLRFITTFNLDRSYCSKLELIFIFQYVSFVVISYPVFSSLSRDPIFHFQSIIAYD